MVGQGGLLQRIWAVVLGRHEDAERTHRLKQTPYGSWWLQARGVVQYVRLAAARSLRVKSGFAEELHMPAFITWPVLLTAVALLNSYLDGPRFRKPSNCKPRPLRRWVELQTQPLQLRAQSLPQLSLLVLLQTWTQVAPLTPGQQTLEQHPQQHPWTNAFGTSNSGVKSIGSSCTIPSGL